MPDAWYVIENIDEVDSPALVVYLATACGRIWSA